MDIIQRNLFKLLRNGAFNTFDKLEPMSAYKWERLYQLAVMHNVIPYAYKGIENCRDQFFLHLTEKQEKEWQKAYSTHIIRRIMRIRIQSSTRERLSVQQSL